MKWEQGRQGTGYEKLCIFKSERFEFDLYLLRYRAGAFIKPHVDPVDANFRHHRINIVLNAAKGGKFILSSSRYLTKSYFNRIFYFRPDICLHAVTKVTSGTRYVLSFGWLTTNKD